jgi:hypothetical protein
MCRMCHGGTLDEILDDEARVIASYGWVLVGVDGYGRHRGGR